jgi:hypothetical protein
MGSVLILCLEKIGVLSRQDFLELKCKKIFEAAGVKLLDVRLDKADYFIF